MTINLYNSLTRSKEELVPLKPGKVGMYVCGPTVYDRAHIGNARAVVVYDVLFRLLRIVYGNENVVFVRNITDVDDKINEAAQRNNESISQLTERVTAWFHDDMDELQNLPPSVEPRATQHIPQIIKLIEDIIKNGHAYVSEKHVLFDVKSFKGTDKYKYGDLSGKKIDELIAGARVEVESYKQNPEDFVLWKPSSNTEPGWQSPWGFGRPGWHIECSAMSCSHLGENFDIHGGGADLKFPHHENEIAQSCAAHIGSSYAQTWIHNGFLTVNGEKMSKSLGNFITVRQLLDKGIKGEVIRYVLLATHYRKPLDFNDKALEEAKDKLDRLYRLLLNPQSNVADSAEFYAALKDDLNTPLALDRLYHLAKAGDCEAVKKAANLLGILQHNPQQWLAESKTSEISEAEIIELISQRKQAKQQKNFAEADNIRKKLAEKGITLEDKPDGTTIWKH